MDDPVMGEVVTMVALADPDDADAAVEIFEHLGEYEIPGAYSRRVTNVHDLDPDLVEAAQYVFADHVPTDFDARSEDPDVFVATYEDGKVSVGFRAFAADLADFTDAVDHVLEATDLTVDLLAVGFDVGLDVTATPGDDPVPDDWMVNTRVHPDGGRSAVSFEYAPMDGEPIHLTGSTDPVRDRVAAAREHLADRLPR